MSTRRNLISRSAAVVWYEAIPNGLEDSISPGRSEIFLSVVSTFTNFSFPIHASMRDWVISGLGQPDYVHFTSAGYRRLAAVLFADILQQYQAYRKTRLEIAESSPHGQAN